MINERNINKLIKLFKRKKQAETDYNNALNKLTPMLESYNDFPLRIGTEGFEFIKNKDNKIFLRQRI